MHILRISISISGRLFLQVAAYSYKSDYLRLHWKAACSDFPAANRFAAAAGIPRHK
jgi:hypothetical protein